MSGVRVGYLRISTPEQKLDNQRDLIKAEKFFEDICTGKHSDRPGFKAMMEFLREGDTLICCSMDRLSRNIDDIRKVISELLDRKIQIEFLRENFIFRDKLSATEQMLMSLMGIVAEFERNVTDERRAIGIKKAKERGAYTGRKPKFTPEIYAEIQRMLSLGARKTTIAKYLGLSLPSVYNYLKFKGPPIRTKL